MNRIWRSLILYSFFFLPLLFSFAFILGLFLFFLTFLWGRRFRVWRGATARGGITFRIGVCGIVLGLLLFALFVRIFFWRLFGLFTFALFNVLVFKAFLILLFDILFVFSRRFFCRLCLLFDFYTFFRWISYLRLWLILLGLRSNSRRQLGSLLGYSLAFNRNRRA